MTIHGPAEYVAQVNAAMRPDSAARLREVISPELFVYETLDPRRPDLPPSRWTVGRLDDGRWVEFQLDRPLPLYTADSIEELCAAVCEAVG